MQSIYHTLCGCVIRAHLFYSVSSGLQTVTIFLGRESPFLRFHRCDYKVNEPLKVFAVSSFVSPANT